MVSLGRRGQGTMREGSHGAPRVNSVRQAQGWLFNRRPHLCPHREWGAPRASSWGFPQKPVTKGCGDGLQGLA